MANQNTELLIKIRADLGRIISDMNQVGNSVEKTGESAQRAKAKIDPFIAAMSKSLSTGEIKLAVGFRDAANAAEVARQKSAALLSVIDKLKTSGIGDESAVKLSQLGLSMGLFTKESAKAGNAAQIAKAKIDPFIAAMSKSLSTGEIKIAAGFAQAGQAAQVAKNKVDDLGRAGESANNKIKTSSDNAASSLSGLRDQFLSLYAAYKIVDGIKAIGTATKQFDSLERAFQASGGVSYAKTLKTINDEADALGLRVLSTAKDFAQLQAASVGTNLEGDKTVKIFESVSRVMSKMGAGEERTHTALLAIGQMMSKGSIQAEELRGQLGEALPGAFNAMARAVGVSTQELSKMLDKGELGIEMLPKFAEELDKTYKSGGFDGMENSLNRIGNAWDRLKNYAGEALNFKVVLKTIADAVTPEASDDKRARLRFQMDGYDENSLADQLSYRLKNGHNLAQDQKELNDILRGENKKRREDELQAESDYIVDLGNKIASETQMIIDGQSDANTRLMKQTRDKIDQETKAKEEAAKRASETYSREREAIAKNIEQLNFELVAMQLSDKEREIQVKIRSLSSKATDDERQQIESKVRAIDAEIQAEKRQQAAWDQAVKDANGYVDLRKEIEDLANSPNLSLDAFSGGLDKIQKMRSELDLTDAQVKKLQDTLGNSFNDSVQKADSSNAMISEFSIQAARNSQSAFADFLFNPFEKGLGGMVESFAKTMQRMLAEAESAQIFNALFGKEFSKTGDISGILGGAFSRVGQSLSSVFSSDFQGNGMLMSYSNHTGGLAGSSAYKQINANLFENAPRYHTGGRAGLMPNEVPSILLKGEEVLTETDPRHINNFKAGDGGNIEINIYNQATGAQATATQRQTSQGSQIDVLIEHVENAVGANISRGTGLAPLLEKQYGLNRSAGSF